MKFQKINGRDYNSQFDVNLFKLTRDNYSNEYTICLEMYFKEDNLGLFNSSLVSFTAINFMIENQSMVKINTPFRYIRSIIHLKSETSVSSFQRRLFINYKSYGINSSPTNLQIHFLIYGLKHKYNNIDSTIYDYNQPFEITPNEIFKMHMLIDMNGFDILKTSHY